MRRLLSVALPLVVAAAVLGAGWQAFRSRSDSLSARADRARLKREFVERAVVARSMGGDRAREAADETRALLRWYFGEAAALRQRYPGEPPPPSLEALLAQRARSAEERQTFEEFFRYAEARMAAMREGRYDPTLVAAAGGLRLDLLTVEPTPNPATKERGLRIDFALWGVPRRTEREAQPTGRTVERAAMSASLRQLVFRFLDADGRPWGEMSGPGQPFLELKDPERFQEDFPPGILFGTWVIDAFPREAARVRVSLEVQVAGAGASGAAATLAFEAPVAEAWKLPAGEKFQGTPREDPSLAPRGKR
jgi:hypothetical protein